jgi:hypothetical protein
MGYNNQPNLAPPVNKLAVTSMVASILSWVNFLFLLCLNYTVIAVLTLATLGLGSILYICTGLIGCLSPIGWIIAIITGHSAKNQIKLTGEGGHGMATSGLVMGYIGLGLVVVGLCLLSILLLAGVISAPNFQSLINPN